MLFLLKPWTFDPGQLSGFRPTADVLVLVTVAFFMGLIVSVRLVRFLGYCSVTLLWREAWCGCAPG